MSNESKRPPLAHASGTPVTDNLNIQTAGPRGPALLQDVWLIEKLAHFDREVIPERRMHAKGAGAHGTFTVTHDITRYTKAKIFSEIGKQTPMFARFSTVAGERGAADAERDIRGFALKFYTEEGNWDMVGNNTPVFFFRDPLRFPDLNHAIKRDPRTGMRSADNNWDFWTLLPEALHQVTIVMSERGIPRSFRHMHGFGSHTYSLINAEERAHLGQIPLPHPAGHPEPDRRGSRGPGGQGPRDPSARSFRQHRGRRFPALDALHSGDDRRAGQGLPVQSVRPDQGLAQRRLPADRGRLFRAQPEPRELLRRGRAGRVLTGQYRAGHQLFAGQDAAGAPLLLWRRAALPPRASTSITSRSTRRNARSTAIIATARCAPTATSGGTPTYFPNSRNEWIDQPNLNEPPLEIDGVGDHWDHRVDDDHYQQPGNLFRMMNAEQRQTLFDNTARQVGGAAKHIQERHIANCAKADPAYGAGVAKALGINFRPQTIAAE